MHRQYTNASSVKRVRNGGFWANWSCCSYILAAELDWSKFNFWTLHFFCVPFFYRYSFFFFFFCSSAQGKYFHHLTIDWKTLPWKDFIDWFYLVYRIQKHIFEVSFHRLSCLFNKWKKKICFWFGGCVNIDGAFRAVERQAHAVCDYVIRPNATNSGVGGETMMNRWSGFFSTSTTAWKVWPAPCSFTFPVQPGQSVQINLLAFNIT